MVDAPAERSEKSVKDHPAASSGALIHQVDMRTASASIADKPDVFKNGSVNFANVHDIYGLNRDVVAPLNPASDTRIAAAAGPHAVTDNGKPKIKTESDQYTVDETKVQGSKDRLANATKDMSPAQAAEFKKNMESLEHRIPPVSADQINKIYDSTTKLIEDPSHTSKLNLEDRRRLAAGILHNAAHPHDIDQGMHNTCNVTTLEERLNMTNPAEAARIVSEVGLTGQFRSKDGKMIQLDAKSLTPDGEALSDARNADGKRNYASQVFDQVTVNDYWQHQKPPLYYSQTTPHGQADTGERLTYANGTEVKGPDGKPMRQPGLGTEAIAQIGKNLGMDGQYVISNTEFDGTRKYEGVNKVSSYQEFEKALSNGQTPAIIFLNGNDKLFTGTDKNGGAGGGHVVSVSDYKSGPPAMVYMSNQWGKDNDKWVKVTDLYNATLPAGSANRVDDQGQKGHIPSDGTSQPGWTRKDEVWRDQQHHQWKDSISSPLNPDNKDPFKDKDHKTPKLDPQIQVAPLQHMLDEAKARKDQGLIDILQNQIDRIMHSN